MNRYFFVLAFSLLISTLPFETNCRAQVPTPGAEGPLKLTWQSSYTQAIQDAAKDKKPIIIDFSTDWCGWSKKMDRETFADPSIQALLKDCTLARINPEQNDENNKIAEKLKVDSYPFIFVMNYKGEVISSQSGYMNVADFKEFLNKIMPVFKKNPLGYEEAKYPADDPVVELIKKIPADETLPTDFGQICLLDKSEIHIAKDGNATETSRTVAYVYNSEANGLPLTARNYNSFYDKLSFKSVRIMKKDGTGRSLDLSLAKDEHYYENQNVYLDARELSIDTPPLQNGDILDITIYREAKPVMPGHASYTWTCNAFLTIKSDLKMTFDPSVHLNRKPLGGPDAVVETKLADDKIQWSLESSCPKNPERVTFQPPPRETTIGCAFASKLEWADVGKWFSELCNGRDELPPDAKQRVAALKQSSKNPKELLTNIFNWVTTDIRYVSVQFGEASHQPHLVKDTLTNRYGDCKDQALLLKTLCKEAGIDASLILLATGYDNTIIDMPSPAWFNHVIVEATIDNQKIYLDPSFGPAPLGYLSTACARAQGLRVAPTGSELIRLPDYQDIGEGNFGKTTIQINPNNSAELTQKIVANGPMARERKRTLAGQSVEKMRLNMDANFKKKGQKLLSLSFTDPEDKSDHFEWEMKFTVPHFGQKLGPDLILNLTRKNQGNGPDLVALLQEPRTTPFYFPPNDTWTEIYDITLPDKTVIKQNVSDAEANETFMTYSRKVETQNNHIILTDKSRFVGGRLPITDAPKVLDAFKKRQDILDSPIVLTIPQPTAPTP